MAVENIELVDSKRSLLAYEESDNVEIEVVDESSLPNFNPPLIGPLYPVLLEVREIFFEPFSFFSNPHMMSGMDDSLNQGVPTTSPSRIIGGT